MKAFAVFIVITLLIIACWLLFIYKPTANTKESTGTAGVTNTNTATPTNTNTATPTNTNTATPTNTNTSDQASTITTIQEVLTASSAPVNGHYVYPEIPDISIIKKIDYKNANVYELYLMKINGIFDFNYPDGSKMLSHTINDSITIYYWVIAIDQYGNVNGYPPFQNTPKLFGKVYQGGYWIPLYNSMSEIPGLNMLSPNSYYDNKKGQKIDLLTSQIIK